MAVENDVLIISKKDFLSLQKDTLNECIKSLLENVPDSLMQTIMIEYTVAVLGMFAAKAFEEEADE